MTTQATEHLVKAFSRQRTADRGGDSWYEYGASCICGWRLPYRREATGSETEAAAREHGPTITPDDPRWFTF